MKSIHHDAPTSSGATAGLERLFELAVLLGDALETGLSEQGLTQARAEVIWRLQHQGPMTQRELSEALRCTPRNVTGLVDALQTAGFVARSPHPTDRRAIMVDLTAQGSSAADAWQTRFQELATFLFADLAVSDLASFVNVLDQVLERFRDTTLATQAD